MIKIIFFDIDGTLLELGQTEMHPILVKTLNKVKQKGIKIFLATGRPPFVVPKFQGINFDGILAYNGSYCFTKDVLIYKNPMDNKDIKTIVENAKKINKAVNLAGLHKMGCNFYDDVLEEYFRIANQHIEPISDFDSMMQDEIYQMMVATLPHQDEQVMQNTSTLKVARWWDRAIDIIPKNGGKDIGIEKILDYYHIKKEESMAFGDGGNDMSMIEYVGCGIAMGNATENVKKAADYVTDSVENDGIIAALKHFNLIEA